MAKASNRRHLESALSEAERALDTARAQLAELQRSNRDLEARMRELEGELERRPPEAEAVEREDGASDQEGTLRDALSREWQLARRVAELEASRSMEPAAPEATEDARALQERIDTLSLQLDAARAREDELAVRAVRAERTLSETGARLAALGQRADEADGLEATLAELRDAFAAEAEDAKTREDAIRLELDDALVRITGLEADLLAARTEGEAAAEAAQQEEARAEAVQDRLRVTEGELAAATELLQHLEEVFAAVRERVDHPRAVADVAAAFPSVTPDTDASTPSALAGAELPTSVRYLEIGDVTEIADREYGPGAPADLSALGDVVAGPTAVDEHGEPLFPGLHVKAAVLLAELIRRRPYLQGNRRIALLATILFLDVNGLDVTGGEDALSELALAVEAGDVPLLSIAATLEALTVPHDGGPPPSMPDVG